MIAQKRLIKKAKVGSFFFYFKKGVRSKIRRLGKAFNPLWKFYQNFDNLRMKKKWEFLFQFFHVDDIDLLLEDHTSSSKLQNFLRRECKNAKIIVYPHSTSLYIKEHVGNTPIIKKTAHLMILFSDLSKEWAAYKLPEIKKI